MSDTCIVADAGPLIILARTGHIRLLKLQFSRIVIPPAVHAECTGAGGKPGAMSIEVEVQTGGIVVQAPVGSVDLRLAPRAIDAGETEAILLAMELRSPVLIDDRAARQAARAAPENTFARGFRPKSRACTTPRGALTYVGKGRSLAAT